MNRIRSAACAAILCALLAAVPAAAEAGDSAPIRPLSDGGLSFPDIAGAASPEEIAYSLKAEHAHDANGATVPTTVALTEDEEGPVLTLTVHFRAGNPAAGGSPFVFPIMGGDGWEGGYRTISVELNEPKPPATEPPPVPPAPTCTVPSLHGFGLPAVKKLLRGADCGVGQVHLARGSAKATGKVVKQFEPAGTQLAPGAPVAVKLAG